MSVTDEPELPAEEGLLNALDLGVRRQPEEHFDGQLTVSELLGRARGSGLPW